MKKPFTGRHMTMLLVGGFGIVIAVNFYMASQAVSNFSGVVVPNSYVASQEFNGWLEKAEHQAALGWSATVSRTKDGHVEVQTGGVPGSGAVSATIRRPLGDAETTQISFVEIEADRFSSVEPVAEGRWIIRLNVSANGQNWAIEKHIE